MSFPLSLRKFITTDELSIINSWLEENSDLFLQSESNDEYWNQRAIYWTLMPSHIQDILMEKVLQIKAIIESIDGPVYAEYPQFIRWKEGAALDPPHADCCNPDGTPNQSPWRSHGAVLYFNEDFEGGELFYPNHNLSIKPKAGMAGIHRADLDCLHGVREVTSGTRMTVSVFFTKDAELAKIKNWF